MKKFKLSYCEEVTHERIFKAKNKKELEKKFLSGELDLGKDDDIIDGQYIEGSLDIDEFGV